MTTTSAIPAPTTKGERHHYAIKRATEACEALDAFQIARLADCGTPGPGTEGADALDTARLIAAEAAEWQLDDVDPDEATVICSGDGADTLADLTDDSVWEGLDGCAVLIYTLRKRNAFHDLDGWSEDVEDFGPPSDLDEAATWALFSILRRAARTVVDEFAEAYAEAVAEFPDLDDEADEDDQ